MSSHPIAEAGSGRARLPSTATIRELALVAGAAGCGVCAADSFPAVEATLRSHITEGTNAKMAFTYRDPAVATDPRRTFPWAERLVAVAWPYLPAAGSPGPEISGTGRIARFAAEDHYRGLHAVLDTIARRLVSAGYQAVTISDDSRLVDRAVAVRAGVGWWGKNTMVLAPGAGPWLLLGAVVTNAPLETSAPMARDCGTCTACLPACPTGALLAPGVLDARRCLAHILQSGGVIPRELRAAVGDRIYGCDDCLEACPPGGRVLAAAPSPRARVDLAGLLATPDDELVARYSHFFIPGRRARYLRRNLLVALGNSGDERTLPVLAGYLGHPDWLLRLHAGWAIGAIGGTGAGPVLDVALEAETHEEVRRELVIVRGAA